MAQSDSGIGNVTPNAELVQMAMSYSRSYMLCAAARLGIADALGDQVRSVDHLAETCQADVDALCIACCVPWPASALQRKRRRNIFG